MLGAFADPVTFHPSPFPGETRMSAQHDARPSGPKPRKSIPATHAALVEAYNRGEITEAQYQRYRQRLQQKALIIEATTRAPDAGGGGKRFRSVAVTLGDEPVATPVSSSRARRRPARRNPVAPRVIKLSVAAALVLMMGGAVIIGLSYVDLGGATIEGRSERVVMPTREHTAAATPEATAATWTPAAQPGEAAAPSAGVVPAASPEPEGAPFPADEAGALAVDTDEGESPPPLETGPGDGPSPAADASPEAPASELAKSTPPHAASPVPDGPAASEPALDRPETVVVEWQTVWPDYEPPSRHPFREWCQLIKRVNRGAALGTVGVCLGPRADSMHERAFRVFSLRLRQDLIAAVREHRSSFHVLEPRPTRLNGVLVERLNIVGRGGRDVGAIYTTVENGRCVAYYFDGDRTLIPTFNALVGTVAIVETGGRAVAAAERDAADPSEAPRREVTVARPGVESAG